MTTWTPERTERLTELWREGVKARLIGKELGVSKSAVVGKAWRLELPRRLSPIRHGGTAPWRKLYLPRSAGLSEAPAPPEPPESEASDPACLFIEGEKGRDFTFYVEAPRCPEAAISGSSYCLAHHRRTRIKPQEAT